MECSVDLIKKNYQYGMLVRNRCYRSKRNVLSMQGLFACKRYYSDRTFILSFCLIKLFFTKSHIHKDISFILD